jgi:polysaccharide biosynthesis/export protein
MGPARLFVIVVLAAAAGACASLPASRMDAAPEPVAANDLDSLAYGRVAARPTVADKSTPDQPTAAHAQVMVETPLAVPPTAAFEGEEPYRLDSGDKLRIVVFGQDGLTSSYVVDSSGTITMPLIKAVTARGLTTDQLARAVADRLRRGFIREPHVAIEVEIYRPFFILGEVTYPGQYPYVPHMTIENAIAIAGGFTPRAYRWEIKLDRPVPGGVIRNAVPPLTKVRPGDTIVVKERWF